MRGLRGNKVRSPALVRLARRALCLVVVFGGSANSVSAQPATERGSQRNTAFWEQSADAVKFALTAELERAIHAQRDAWKKSEMQMHGPIIRSTIYLGVRRDVAPGTKG